MPEYDVAVLFGAEVCNHAKLYGVTPYVYDSVKVRRCSSAAVRDAYLQGMQKSQGFHHRVSLVSKKHLETYGHDPLITVGVKTERYGSDDDIVPIDYVHFAEPAERKAYENGIEDAYGWSSFYSLTGEPLGAFLAAYNQSRPVNAYSLTHPAQDIDLQVMSYLNLQALREEVDSFVGGARIRIKVLDQVPATFAPDCVCLSHAVLQDAIQAWLKHLPTSISTPDRLPAAPLSI